MFWKENPVKSKLIKFIELVNFIVGVFRSDTGRCTRPVGYRIFFGWGPGKREVRGAHEIYMKRIALMRSDAQWASRSPPHCPRSFAERTGCTGHAPLASTAKSTPKNRHPSTEHFFASCFNTIHRCCTSSFTLPLPSVRRFRSFSSNGTRTTLGHVARLN